MLASGRGRGQGAGYTTGAGGRILERRGLAN